MDQLRRGPRVRERGFTLIEVMVALGILAAGLLTVAAAQIYAMRGGATGKHTSDAATFAHSQLENFQRVEFSHADLTQTGGVWVPAGGRLEQRVIETSAGNLVEMNYRLQWRVRDVDQNLKAVDLRVTWDEPQRPGRSVTLSTMVHNDPPTGG
jgi:prepilin-type N-terminal cleavage/methylation domain-containing protein